MPGGKSHAKLVRRHPSVPRKIRLSRKKACKQDRLGRLIISCLSFPDAPITTALVSRHGTTSIYFRRRRRRAPRVSIMGGVNEASSRQYSHAYPSTDKRKHGVRRWRLQLGHVPIFNGDVREFCRPCRNSFVTRPKAARKTFAL